VKRTIAAVSALLVLTSAPSIAHAEPIAPQPDTPCAGNLDGALTQLPDLTTLLQCRAGRWEVFADPYPNSERWLTYGPKTTLHGEAQRNREIDSGEWVGSPQDPDTQCAAEQVAIADTGSLGPPEMSTGELGRPLTLRLKPLLFTVELRGHCLWEKR
jgi:hypothetical protein